MLRITLGPLDSAAAQAIAQRRGVQVSDLVSTLIQREAAIEIADWQTSPQAAPASLHPATESSQRVVSSVSGN